jgi:hypothetical protein
MTESISLTLTFQNRLKKANDAGIQNKHFIPDTFDFIRNFASYSKNNERIFDPVKGFSRIDNKRFAFKQINDLRNLIKKFGVNVRYLQRYPDNYHDYNSLRNSFNSIQNQAGAKRLFISAGKQETYESVDNYLDTIEEEFVLVLDIAMISREFQRLLEKYVGICEEVVLLYRNWDEFKANIELSIAVAKANPDKIHMAFVPLDLTAIGTGKLFGTALICSGFKSVSFVDTEFPAYIRKHLKSNKKERSLQEQIEFSRWVNHEMMSYDKRHLSYCNCYGSRLSVEEAINKCGLKEAITFHNLEVLSMVYKEIKKDEGFKKKILALENMKSLLSSLKSSKTS